MATVTVTLEDGSEAVRTLATNEVDNLVGIVRDKDGNVRYKDPHNVPSAIFNQLTPEDIEHLNKLRNQ